MSSPTVAPASPLRHHFSAAHLSVHQHHFHAHHAPRPQRVGRVTAAGADEPAAYRRGASSAPPCVGHLLDLEAAQKEIRSIFLRAAAFERVVEGRESDGDDDDDEEDYEARRLPLARAHNPHGLVLDRSHSATQGSSDSEDDEFALGAAGAAAPLPPHARQRLVQPSASRRSSARRASIEDLERDCA